MTKKAADSEPLSLTHAQWSARWEDAGQKAFAAGRECQFTSDVLASVVHSLSTIQASDPEVFALLARKGLDHQFFVGLSTLGARLQALDNRQPPDRRRVPVLSAADKQVVDTAHDALSFAKAVAASAASAIDRVQDVKALGRGVRVNRSPAGVHDGIQLFISNLAECKDLLADGGFGQDEIDQLAAFLPQLDAILISKGKRVKERDSSSDEMDMLGLGIESGLHIFRARASTALHAKPLLLTRALAHLPRTPERRTKSVPASGTAQVASPPPARASASN